MIEMTHNNHFKWWYDTGHYFGNRNNNDQQWKVAYGSIERQPLDFKEECIETAKLIYEKSNGNVVILYSGGVDSEVVCESFRLANLPFKLVSMRFNNNYNDHDISYVKKYSQKYNLKVDWLELDILEFWLTESYKLAEISQVNTPQFTPLQWALDQIHDYVVLGSAECLFKKEVPKDYEPGLSPYERSKWYLLEKEFVSGLYKHQLYRGKNACIGFFQYTPEIMLSYMNIPYVKDLYNDKIIGKLSTVTSKHKIYKMYFGVDERKKYTGYEKLGPYDKFHREILTKKYKSDQVKTYIDELRKMLEHG